MQIEPEEAVAHLCAADAVLARIIAATGPFAMRADGDDPFRSLARAIVYQQLSGKAAATIYRRFVGLFDPAGEDGAPLLSRSDPDWSPLAEPFPEPAAVLALTDDQFRAAGLSRQKTAALRSLAEHFASGELGHEQFTRMSDDEVIAHLTRVRGIGVWSAQMFLMFHLRRPDVLPVNDLGVNRAIMRQYGLPAMPSPAEVQRVGAPWRPWATVACWYLWRSEDVRLPTGEG
ncbi:MAG: DNA-3-methyladenine glycosylase 2 family protein [Dehalococcoidia bacterium]|nr:DNA-3-methyladenine glycosylase 2 family protein [Dehalococcoidia bacterium]